MEHVQQGNGFSRLADVPEEAVEAAQQGGALSPSGAISPSSADYAGSISCRLANATKKFQPHRLMDRSRAGIRSERQKIASSKPRVVVTARAKLGRQQTFKEASEDDLIAAGFTPAQAEGVLMGRAQTSSAPNRRGGPPSPELTQLMELKRVGFTPKELKDVGFSPAVLRSAGFSPAEVCFNACAARCLGRLCAPNALSCCLSAPVVVATDAD